MKCQQDQHQQQGYFSGTATAGFNDHFSFSPIQLHNSQSAIVNMIAANDDSTTPHRTVFDDLNSVISRTYSCPPILVAQPLSQPKHKDTDLANINSSIQKQSSKKRKADKPHNSTKVVAEMDKRVKSKVQRKKNETCSHTSKGSHVEKAEYIHVRAHRGQATDRHSLAERIRREKISERMKYLQDLVPGCNKVTGKAGTLDEIINYVQSLQGQVEFLSMKLAAMNPTLDFNNYDMFTKEMFPTCTPSYSTIGISSDITSPSYLQFMSQQEMVSSCGLDTVKNLPELHGSNFPETFHGSSSFNQVLPPSSTWEGDFQNLCYVAFDQAIATPFSSQQFTGVVEASNLMEK